MPRTKKTFNRRQANQNKVDTRPKKIGVTRLLGMKDILSTDYKLWQSVINKLNEVANLYSFGRTETPVIEDAILYKKSPRLKDLYVWSPNHKDKIALRSDLTRGLARAYVENDMYNLPQPVRLFSFGPVFRLEPKVQTGTYRQFTQFAFEIFGEEGPAGEALLMEIIYSIFKELQIEVQIQINSVGDYDCQKEYFQKLLKYYREKSHKSKLCPDCKKAFLKEPLKLLECSSEACREIRKEAPQITSFLSEESSKYFTRVLEYLDELNINYNFDPFLVKNYNYYTETIFEVWPLGDNKEVDRRWSLGRGGRYNKLLDDIGGRSGTALGFAGGVERTVLKMKDKDLPFKKEDNIIFIAQLSEAARVKSMQLFTELNKSGFNVRQSFSVDDLREQLEEAKRLNAKIILILGKKEVSAETIIFRDVEIGVQEVINQKDLKERMHKRLGNK